ncbi:MAG: hypothetical protein QG599_2204 [Pseudomonadota bacterium]|nr:hypothetical protein [Pseudomonadota bacterium]
MDIETRLEELAQAYVTGQLSEAELARLQKEALREAGNSSAMGRNYSKASSVNGSAGSDSLSAGKTIGPPERRMQLAHDLSGWRRLWLAHPALSAQGRENPEEFRAIKILLPVGQEPGSGGPVRDERASRVDMINLRSYLAKVKARVQLATRLEHPVIARIYGWRQGADGWPFAEMEYVNPHHGHTLAQLLEESGRNGQTWETIAQWLRPVAMALDYAHGEHRFAHQNIDADTIFITDQGTIRLLGFGLATEIREPRSVLFSTGSGRDASGDGSADSVSTETTFRRDVFALALLIYRLLAGRSVQEAQGQPPGAVPRPPGLTDDAWQVLRRGLAYPSELCPTNAGQFIQMLDAAQLSAMATARSGALPKWIWGLAAALAAAISGGVYWFNQPVDRVPISAVATSEPVPEIKTPVSPPVDEGVSLQAAEREIDQQAFEAARRVDSIAAYQLYLQRCPRCGYGKEARITITALESRKKIEMLKADFAALAPAFEDGHEERGHEALTRLEALVELTPDDPLIPEGRRRLARGWVKMALTSLNKSNPEDARKWLKKAQAIDPELPELVPLNQALIQAEAVAQVRQTDIEAFAAARRIDTRRAYWDYLDRCGTNCGHRTEAETALARLTPAYAALRDRLNDGSQGPEMIVIPAGEFSMGSPPAETGRYSDEHLQSVRIEKSFAIGKYEIMFHEYDRFATVTKRSLPSDHDWGRSRRPVINIDWNSATAYAEWLSQETGQRYRLPTEAEWEYAARAKTTTSRYWGNDPNEGCAYANAGDLDGKKVFVGWTAMQCHDGQVYTAPVGSYRSNEFGLYDMLGNVLEWTCSIYNKESKAPVQRCQEPVGEQEMVVRGGSWSDEPRNVRSADRHRNRPEFRDYFLGFRLVRELP